MGATGTRRARKSARRFASEAQRAFLASGIVLVVCVFAVAVANRSHASVNPASQSHTLSEADFATGSVLIVPATGTLCRESTIDNSTWQIRNKGWVDCAGAMTKTTNAVAEARSPGSRLDAIRESFRGKP